MRTLRCTAIVFDLDGVLVDSSAVVERHWRRWAAEHGIDVESIFSISTGKRNLEVMSEIAPHLDAVREAAAMDAAEALDLVGLHRFPGSQNILSALPKHRWAIATSGSRDTATARLKAVGLPIPRILITADDVQNGKPHPEPYKRAAEGLGISPDECIVIEDAPSGIESASSAGMTVIGVATSLPMDALRAAHTVVPSLKHVNVNIKPHPIHEEVIEIELLD